MEMAVVFRFLSLCLFVLIIFSRLRTSHGQSCGPTDSVDLKAYKSSVVLEATLRKLKSYGWDAKVSRIIHGAPKSVRGRLIHISGFGLQERCTIERNNFEAKSSYIFFLNQLNTTDSFDFYLTANPVEINKPNRKAASKGIRNGSPPRIRKLQGGGVIPQNEKHILQCVISSSLPKPIIHWYKDRKRLEKDSIRGVKLKFGRKFGRITIKSSKKDLHSGTYTCVLDNTVDPPVNSSSTLEICALTCSNNGTLRLKACHCKCLKGWTGLTCDQPEPQAGEDECTRKCVNGILNQTSCKCQCNEGWKGSKCKTCDRDCSGHGVADTRNGCQCVCEEGYSLVDSTCVLTPRENKTCNLTCMHGSLNEKACNCSCNPNFEGVDCSVDKVALCREETYCKNGGYCFDDQNQEKQCRCVEGVTGKRCQQSVCELQCENGGVLNRFECACDCTGTGFSGPACETAASHHRIVACPEEYANWCLNGGNCSMIIGTKEHYCVCPLNKIGDRCQHTDPEGPCARKGPYYCLNGGKCRFVPEENNVECICPENYAGDERCNIMTGDPDLINAEVDKDNYKPPYQHFSEEENSKKLIICMAIICVSLILIMALLVFAYVKNKSAKEKEKRERDLLQHRSMTPPHQPARPNSFNLSSGSARVGSLELTQFETNQRPARYSDGNIKRALHNQGRTSSHPLINSGSATVPRTGTPNGHAHKVSQASIHSTRSQGSQQSISSSRHGEPAHVKAYPKKNGYTVIPTTEILEADEPIRIKNSLAEYPNATQEERQRLEDMQEPDQEDTESENSSTNGDNEGDRVDDLNPQIEALHSHPGLTEAELEGDSYSSADYSTSDYMSQLYGMDSLPRSPHRTHPRVTHGSPRHMNIHSNPLDMSHSVNRLPKANAIDIKREDGHYVNRLRDVVENSPPSAV